MRSLGVTWRLSKGGCNSGQNPHLSVHGYKGTGLADLETEGLTKHESASDADSEGASDSPLCPGDVGRRSQLLCTWVDPVRNLRECPRAAQKPLPVWGLLLEVVFLTPWEG